MPLFHCSSCHHEWEGSNTAGECCQWCGDYGYVLAPKTQFEEFMEQFFGFFKTGKGG